MFVTVTCAELPLSHHLLPVLNLRGAIQENDVLLVATERLRAADDWPPPPRTPGRPACRRLPRRGMPGDSVRRASTPDGLRAPLGQRVALPQRVREDSRTSTAVCVCIWTAVWRPRGPHLKVDVNVGDAISPEPKLIHLPRLVDSGVTIDLIGYPLSMVHAERSLPPSAGCG